MDEYLTELNDWLQTTGVQSILAPGNMFPGLQAAFPHVALRSYLAEPEDLAGIDTVILHKGLMARLDPAIVLECYTQWTLAFANPVYCGYRREATEGQNTKSLLEHVGPVEALIRQAHDHAALPDDARQSGLTAACALRSALIVSAYGVGNVGDDLVTLATETMLRAAGIAQVSLSGPSADLAAIAAHDAVVLGGGGLLYDTDIENLENYLYPLLAGRRLGKAVCVLGVGTQSIETTEGRRSVARALLDADLVSVRAAYDAAVLQGIDPRLGADTLHGTDQAFYLAGPLRQRRIPFSVNKPLAILSLSAATADKIGGTFAMTALYCELISRLRDTGYSVLLALHSHDDRELFKSVLARQPGTPCADLAALGPWATASLYGASSLIVTSRFHAVIYGAISGKQIVAIHEGDCKIRRIIDEDFKSIRDQLLSARNLTAAAIMAAVATGLAPTPEEVAACEKRADAMAAALTTSLSPNGMPL